MSYERARAISNALFDDLRGRKVFKLLMEPGALPVRLDAPISPKILTELRNDWTQIILAQIEAEVATLRESEGRQWQDISTAPTDVRIVASYFGARKEYDTAAAVVKFFQWENMPRRLATGWPFSEVEPTHWVPVPTPPCDSGSDGNGEDRPGGQP